MEYFLKLCDSKRNDLMNMSFHLTVAVYRQDRRTHTWHLLARSSRCGCSRHFVLNMDFQLSQTNPRQWYWNSIKCQVTVNNNKTTISSTAKYVVKPSFQVAFIAMYENKIHLDSSEQIQIYSMALHLVASRIITYRKWPFSAFAKQQPNLAQMAQSL